MHKLMAIYVAVNFLFLACGGLLLGFSLVGEQQERGTKTVSNVVYDVLLTQCPLTGGVVNAIFMFFTFIVSLPALAMPLNRFWLKLQGWLLLFNALFTLTLGLVIWFDTLQVRANFSSVWAAQSTAVQSLLEQRFQCCGYDTTAVFVVNGVCADGLAAAGRETCVGPMTVFANSYLDLIFTTAFGIVGVDVLLLVFVAMVLKFRSEQERYRHIDEKSGNY